MHISLGSLCSRGERYAHLQQFLLSLNNKKNVCGFTHGVCLGVVVCLRSKFKELFGVYLLVLKHAMICTRYMMKSWS